MYVYKFILMLFIINYMVCIFIIITYILNKDIEKLLLYVIFLQFKMPLLKTFSVAFVIIIFTNIIIEYYHIKVAKSITGEISKKFPGKLSMQFIEI